MGTRHIRKSGQWKKRRKGGAINLLESFKKFDRKSLVKNLITLAVLGGVLGFFVIAIMFAIYSRDLPDPNQLTSRHISQSTKILDRTGEHLLYEIHGGEKRTLKKLQEGFCEDDEKLEFDENGIPLYALHATIAAEDHKFCSHHGYSLTGLLRAVIFRGSRGGGSTLTQQLVKNAILTNERTINRKVKELILSVELERRYSKDEILQIYFNEIPYGSTNYGIESAAQAYFGKPANEITLAESATLAALPKAPTTYLNNPDRLKIRRDFILNEMKDRNFIEDDQYEQALNEDTSITFHITDITAPHFVFYVKQQLEESYGQRVVEEGGLSVTTTIDYDVQISAEEAVEEGVDELGESLGFTNASLVAIDPKNGQIIAMVGSKDYFDEDIDGSVNVSTRLRQPGSSFKPIVYSAAFERGYTPNTILWDVKTTFKTDVGDYSPQNFDGGERGPVTLRQALQGSLNIPAVKLIYMTGLEYAFDFAKKLGYSDFRDLSNYGLSMVLGGAEVQLLEHTNAFATFANEGKHYDIVSVLKVEDPDGVVLEEWEEEDGDQVMDENLARTITNVLSDNGSRAYVFGGGSYLQLGDRPVAAKTGTTNDSRDAWLMGYTPSLAAGVWAGNNDNSKMSARAGGSSAAGPIWNSFMHKALDGTSVEYFTYPTIPTTGKNIIDGVLPAQTVTIDTVSGKLATEHTPEEFRDTIQCIDFHSILHYVSPSDPLGGEPNRPEKDSQYESWEANLQDWVNRKNEENPEEPPITRCEIPTEEDDVHTRRNQPSVSIDRNDVSDGRFLDVLVDIRAPRPISRVEYRIDGKFVLMATNSPFSANFEAPPSFGSGTHTITATAFDDVGNRGSDEASIVLGHPGRSTDITILDPRDGQGIEKIQEKFSVSVQLRNPSRYSEVSLTVSDRNKGVSSIVGSALNPESPFVTIRWPIPEPGDYILQVFAETPSVQIDASQPIIVHVKEGEMMVEEEAASETTEDEASPPEVIEFDPFGFL